MVESWLTVQKKVKIHNQVEIIGDNVHTITPSRDTTTLNNETSICSNNMLLVDKRKEKSLEQEKN